MGKAAVVTGASSGIGEQLARLLAQDGYDVVLAARNGPRLEALAERLRLHKVSPWVVPVDLSSPDGPQALYRAVQARGLSVEVLANNAGVGSSGDFLDLPLEGESAMVGLNCQALVALCHLFGRDMRAAGRGRILNVASTAGFFPGPYMATYYATKAFVVSFSTALSHELQGTGVTVTCHCPGPVHTEFAGRAGVREARLFSRPDVATPEDVALDAYEALMQGEVLKVYGAFNQLSVGSSRVLPRSWQVLVTAQLNRPPSR